MLRSVIWSQGTTPCVPVQHRQPASHVLQGRSGTCPSALPEALAVTCPIPLARKRHIHKPDFPPHPFSPEVTDTLSSLLSHRDALPWPQKSLRVLLAPRCSLTHVSRIFSPSTVNSATMRVLGPWLASREEPRKCFTLEMVDPILPLLIGSWACRAVGRQHLVPPPMCPQRLICQAASFGESQGCGRNSMPSPSPRPIIPLPTNLTCKAIHPSSLMDLRSRPG